ncbi:unnamed protein product [Urochloa humidicola]
MYIPAGRIDGGRTQYMATNFTVPAFPVAGPASAASAAQPTTISVPASGPSPHVTAALVEQQQQQPPVMEVESLLVVKGKVTVLKVLTHRVQAAKVCRIGISPADGRVLGFRC